MSNVKFLTAVVCDDIRKEMNNKDILIGAFGSDINVQMFPAAIALAFWVQMVADAPGEYPVDFKVVWSGTDLGNEFKGGKLNVVRAGPFAAALPQTLCEMKGPGNVRLMGKVGNGDWELIVEKKIELAVV